MQFFKNKGLLSKLLIIMGLIISYLIIRYLPEALFIGVLSLCLYVIYIIIIDRIKNRTK